MGMSYTIYHIPGIKIGCTSQLERRLKIQGYTDYEVLEVHEDIEKASVREKELQREYGYNKDSASYLQVREMGLVGSWKGGKVARESGQLDSVRHIGQRKNSITIRTCPHCGKTGKGLIMFRFHFDKCKYKK